MGDTQQPYRSIALIAAASEQEAEAFRRICAEESHQIVTGAGTSDCVSVLLVGAGMAHAATRLASEGQGPFQLLVAYDISILRHLELLGQCENILVSPVEGAQLRRMLRELSASVQLDAGVHANIVGCSPQVRELLRVMSAVARYDAPVLIKGETGTGKELVARGIHYSSARRDHPFVPVNCGALNDELLLAELFGYEKGAFTDAKRTHQGLVAQAAGGVLFLDEIDSLSPRGQAALLRFLQEQEYRPLGGATVLKSDVRVVTATNKDLAQWVRQGTFREDLYYRIHLLDVRIPALRDRTGDVELLAEHFLAQFSERHATAPKRLHPVTLQWMLEYGWPGNIRELQNYLYRAFVLSRGPTILAPRVLADPIALQARQEAQAVPGTTADWGAQEPSETSGKSDASDPAETAVDDAELQSFSSEKLRALEQFERRYLHRVMKAAEGNVSLAARRAGKERRAFRRLLTKHGIQRQSYN